MYLGKSCQLKIKYFAIFCLILFTACAELETEVVREHTASPVWFVGPEHFTQSELNGATTIHPFFDLVPFSSKLDNGVNFFPLFSSDDPAFFDFNLRSGKIFSRYPFCSRKDIWRKYSSNLGRPNFTYGIVPRLLDQIGSPQTIVVFGNKDYYNGIPKYITDSHRVRVVGGVLEQFCKEYPCSTSNEWISRLVLIAVDMNDTSFKDVFTFAELKEKVDWDYARTFLENLYGGTRVGSDILPAFRVTGEIDGKRSLDAAVKKGHLFRFKDMMALRKGCHELYDYVWGSVSKIRSGKAKRDSFSRFFADFYTKYGKQYRNCSKLVSGPNLNSNIDRFWFFAFFNSFFEMERSGYVYRCSRTAWMRNPINPVTSRPVYDTMKVYKHCSDRQLDSAFESAPVMLAGMSTSGTPFSRFIEYDSGSYGSHQRIFNWARWSGKEYLCRGEEKEKVSSLKDVFPTDIVWERFYKKKTINKSMLIK